MITRKFGLKLRLVLKDAVHNLTWSQLKCCRLLSRTANSFAYGEDFIKSHTVITNDHLTPELNLRLITPKCELWHSDPKGRFQFENDPFWAIYWPGGQALSRYILDNRSEFKGKNVIDIGSGSGACAIAAAKSGANLVLANDIDELSLKAVKLNAELNEVEVFVEKEDLIGKNIDSLEIVRHNSILKPKWDVVLIGDMFYDADFSLKLFMWVFHLYSSGKTVLIGDPGRHAMKDILNTNNKFIKVADYPVRNAEHYGFSSYSVWKVA